MSAARLRVADVIRCCWASYNRTHRLAPHVARAAGHILRCRTPALGAHVHECDHCGSHIPVYNSCRSRHCPTCQNHAKAQWLDARLGERLPVQYFHVVFTLPHALNLLVDANRALLLGELFATANWVLQRFARDRRWRLEGQLGFLAILHTWTQRLKLHFHVHCIVPGGVWRAASKPSGEDGRAGKTRWKPCRGKWLFRKQSLSDAFRNRYIKRLRALRKRGKLRCTGRAARFEDKAFWDALLGKLEQAQWIVYPKPVPGDAAHALDYVARYTHKVAIGDYRIKALENGRVSYTWRDRADGNREKTDTLPAGEFTRRFLSHILPDGFHKIRYFGWMAATRRKANLADIRAALGVEPPVMTEKEPFAQRIRRETGIDITLCPHCQQGRIQPTDRQIPPRSQSP